MNKNKNIIKALTKAITAVLTFNLAASLVLAAAGPVWNSNPLPPPNTEIKIASSQGDATSPYFQYSTKIIKSGSNYFTYWTENNTPRNYQLSQFTQLRVQKYDSNGVAQIPNSTTPEPLVIQSQSIKSNVNNTPIATIDGNGGIFLVWTTTPTDNSVSQAVYATHVLSNGTIDSNYPENGKKLFTSTVYQEINAVVSDNQSGFTLLYKESNVPYIARFQSDGTTKSGWNAGGTNVVNALVYSNIYLIKTTDTISPGVETAYLALIPINGNLALYKILSDGTVVTTNGNNWANGLNVHTFTYSSINQYGITEDTNDGAYVFYTENDENSNNVLYTIHIESDGTKAPNSLAIYSTSTYGYLDNIRISSDNSGQAIIVFNDNEGLQGQLVTSSNKIWNSGSPITIFPIVNTRIDGKNHIDVTSNGNIFITMQAVQSGAATHVLSQLLNPSTGEKIFTDNFPISSDKYNINNTFSYNTDAEIAAIDGNNLLTVWDTQNGDGTKIPYMARDNYLQKINQSQQLQFSHTNPITNETETAIPITALTDRSTLIHTNSQTIHTTDNNYITIWSDTRNGFYDIYGEKSTIGGQKLWNPSQSGYGKAILITVGNKKARIFADTDTNNQGGAFLLINNEYTSNETTFSSLNLLKITTDGNVYPGWPSQGINLDNNPTKGKESPTALSDGEGGVFVAWAEELNNEGRNLTVKVNHINKNGESTWGTSQNPETTQSLNNNFRPQIITDNQGGIFVTYLSNTRTEYPNAITGLFNTAHAYYGQTTGNTIYNTRAMHFNNNGDKLWSESKTIAAKSIQSESVSDQNGGLITVFTYEDRPLKSGAELSIYLHAQRTDNNGNIQWPLNDPKLTGEPINSTEIPLSDYYTQVESDLILVPHIISDNNKTNGGAIIVYQDPWLKSETAGWTNDNIILDITAQKIDHNGVKQWGDSGIQLSSRTDNKSQFLPQIDSNGGHGALINYLSQNENDNNKFDLVIHNLSANGTKQWGDYGILYNNDRNLNITPSLSSDGHGGAVITWENSANYGLGLDSSAYPLNVIGNIVDEQQGNLDPSPSDLIVYGQYITDPAYTSLSGACLDSIGTTSQQNTQSTEQTEQTFCAQQEIAEKILSFVNIPSSFNFDPIVVNGGKIERFNNKDSATAPSSDDLLGVQDNRNEGGFIVQLQANSNLIDETQTQQQEIDLSNCDKANSALSETACLKVVTSVNSTNVITDDPTISGTPTEKNNGVIYETDTAKAATNTIQAPIDAGSDAINSANTYNKSSNDLGAINQLDSQHKQKNIIDLMIGSLNPSNSNPDLRGRDGKFYQYLSYYLKIPALPAPKPGNYSIILTYTLMEAND